jgi:hypothetical protein
MRNSSPSGNLGYSADHAGIEVDEHRAGHVLAAQGLAVQNVDAAELLLVATAVLAAVADAVLVAHHLSKLGAHLATALTRLHAHNPARRSSPEVGNTRDKKGEEEQRNVRSTVW